MKKIFFQTHWLLGITAGIVLMIVGITGALLSFEHELLQWMNRDVVWIAPQGERLPLNDLFAKVKVAYPDREVMSVTVDAAADHSVAVTFVAVNGSAEASKSIKGPQRRRGEVRYFNPYDGALLSREEMVGQATLQTIERVHRGMVAGPLGRTVVGSCALLLFLMALSGLYLRWPRRGKMQWQTWFKVSPQLTGRAYLWNLHTVVATCVLPLVLISALTGAYQAFDWYRKGVMNIVGATPPSREATKLEQPLQSSDTNLNIDLLWSSFQREHGDFKTATMVFPPSRAHAVEIRYLTADSPHERAINLIALHPLTGDVIKQDIFAEKKTGNRFVSGILPLHTGSYFGAVGQVLMMLSALSMPFFAVTGWMMYWQRKHRLKEATSTNLAESSLVG